ncbi:MAG: response regulator [Cyclobacteriaceae bacterium]
MFKENLVALKFCLLLVITVVIGQANAQVGDEGFVDLRETNLEESISLDGKWWFYWKELISADQFSADNAELVDFPMIWNNLPETDYNANGYGTYQIKVILDPDGDYAVTVPPLYNSYRFYVNNELIAQNGIVGRNKETSTPQWRLETQEIPKEILADTNVFTLQVSNYRHTRGGPYRSIKFGNSEYLKGKQNIILTLDALLTGALIMGGLFFLGLYFFGRKQLSILYFSLFCLSFSYFIFGRDSYLVTWLFPEVSWLLAVKLEYIIIYLMSIFLIRYVYCTYPEDSLPIFDIVIMGVAGLFIVLVVITPPVFFTKLLMIYIIFVLIGIVVGFYIYIKALINKRPGSRFGFLGISIILTVLGLISLEHLGYIRVPEFIGPLGYIVFFFLQSVTTSQQVAIAWEENRKEAEAALQAKSDFLSTMSHEIRTPMNAVIGLTHHLIDSHPRKDQMGSLSTLKFSSENLLRLLNDILDYNKLEAGALLLEENLIDLKSLGANLVSGFKPIAEEKKTVLEFVFDPKLPSLYKGDEGRLTQVLSNLIGNAIKFTKNGTVRVSMMLVQRDPEDIAIRFSVKDTGIGISQLDREKIFERFNQANTSINRTYGGTGLGLAISKKILELQGVQIQLNSEIGKGSEFFFTMRLKLAKGHRQKVSKPSLLVDPLKDKRILLVEDNAINIMVAQRFLEKWHCEVEVAENGQIAMDKYEPNKYDLILMDLQMPVMDGYQATKALREQGAQLPILALTAAALLDLEQQMKETGLTDFVVKPFHPDHLYEKLIKYLVPHGAS